MPTIANGPYDPMTDPIYDGIPDRIRRLLATEPPDLNDEDQALVEEALRAAAETSKIPVEIWARELAKSLVESGTDYDRQFTKADAP